ncbi:MAG TPA: hypothetical protein VL691_05090 [Vicinamibacteria bacterium]|nr:hypothetical protein [Vicinamibacteria bacterium]
MNRSSVPGGRRRFLRLSVGLPVGLSGWLANGCSSPGSGGSTRTGAGPDPTAAAGDAIVVPKVNGGMNVHSLRCLSCAPTDETIDPALVALQLSAVYELGFDGIRIAAPFGDRNTFLSTVAYVRAARAVGIDAVVLLADFSGFTLAHALHGDESRPTVLKMYADVLAIPPEPTAPALGGLGPKGVGRIAFQILNEPAAFLGLPPDVYVQEILNPCFGDLGRIDPRIIVVSAAEVGNKAGPARIRAMLEAGLETTTNRIAYHIYERDVIPLLPSHVRAVVWVTESGVAGIPQHLPWVRDVFPEIRAQLPDVLRIFYYDLFDSDQGVYRILDIQPAGEGYRAVVESTELHDYWADKVGAAAAGRPLVGFSTLIPDVRAYFPTPADAAAFDEAFAEATR